MNFLPREFPTLQECLVGSCEIQTKSSPGLRGCIEEGRGDGEDEGGGLHELA